MNAGGPDYTDPVGNLWETDAGYYNTGSAYFNDVAIANTDRDPLYQNERWDPASGEEMLYRFPTPPGTYTVRLHFAEIYSDSASVGSRIFDVTIEGEPVLTGYDIYAAAGFGTAILRRSLLAIER